MKPEVKKLIIANLPYLLFVYLFGKLGQAYRLAEGIDLSQKLLHYADGCAAAFESAAPSFNPTDLLIGVAGAAALRLMVYCKGKNAKKYRKGVEYGSARWGGPKDIAPYIDPNFDNNILLTQTERITMNNRPKDPKTARNKNVLVIGGSGSGKTRFFVKPNLMQCVSKDYPTSFVITDPKGSLIGEVGQLLMAEAEKYVGYPYVWGGSSPSTSFDCSGFVSWVINHSGWDVGRLGAQGLCNICTPVSPEQAKPGDLVFFVGTYDTPGVSHVGIYVGNSVMLHCGDPISYTNLNSSYWQQHFYCYGRLP